MSADAFRVETFGRYMGACLVRHRLHEDRRGTSERVFDSSLLPMLVGGYRLRDDPQKPADYVRAIRDLPESELVSWSKSSVVRGMHIQTAERPQWKHVRCSRGGIHAVVLDLRAQVPGCSYKNGEIASTEIHETGRVSLWIPPWCAFGYAVLSDGAEVHYRIFGARVESAERVIGWDSFGHRWPLGNPVLSDRDNQAPAFADVTDLGW